jgi:hypothetical protein
MRDSEGVRRVACFGLRDWDTEGVLARDDEFSDDPFWAPGEQVRPGVGEGRIAAVEAGPILRMVLDFGFRIGVLGVRGEKDFGYCGLP